MDLSGAGTAIMLALAAVLWFLYLLPTWMRRHEYLTTERNATRLQRAIRVMAESAEMPDEVRVEASAREVAHQERLLREQRRREDAVARSEVRAAEARARAAEAQAADIERAARQAEAARRVAVARAEAARPAVLTASLADAAARSADGLRRARRLAGLLLLAALAVAAVQGWLMLTTGAVVGSWVVLAGCAVAGVSSLMLQRRIVARTRSLSPTAAPVSRATRSSSLLDAEPIAAPVAAREWTPVPIPKPLYVERQEPERVPVVAPIRADELQRAAAAEVERMIAAAHAEPEVVPFPAPSRYASMGVVDAPAGGPPDLDEILRRRRSG